MTLNELLSLMNAGKSIPGGSEGHRLMVQTSNSAMRLTMELNTKYHNPGEVQEIFAKLTGTQPDPTFRLFPPFYTDFGRNLHVGRNVFINSGSHFQDQGGITIGDGCLIGHCVVMATINHDLDPAHRADNHLAPITLGKNVWVGSHATILPGVTIGDGAVVGAGAVVTRDVPALAVVGGVPARILRRIEMDEAPPGL